ncbi:hypothetical protein K502DRAFT_177008 [Neoconidiobolus thromboides FSU 785]|nr:hypothetical protein K502DRAFT_177008 [Neoconidiobolus thromboides FSU 785]
MSKSAYKKMKKRELREETHKEWITQVRQKQKMKKKERKQLIKQGLIEDQYKPKPKVENQVALPLKIVIDMDFDKLMNDKEISSVCNQVARCYAFNRQNENQVNLYVTDIKGRILEYFNTKKQDSKNWKDVTLTENHFGNLINKEDTIYLTADAEDTISELDITKTYIIGGIVDKNRHKFLTLNKAKELGIKSAKLPIGDYIKIASRKVLAVNHVFEILLQYLNIKDWEQAFLKVIPQRRLRQNMNITDINENGDEQEGKDVDDANDKEDEQDENDKENQEEDKNDESDDKEIDKRN